ncbi:MAG: HNH endonuclease [Candidatus Acidiferrales bacterium]
MTRIRTKRPRLKLDPEADRQLHHEVLKRDGWRCQGCGRTESLQVHHIKPRGRLGDDAEENLITLCSDCHQACHGSPAYSIHGKDSTTR